MMKFLLLCLLIASATCEDLKDRLFDGIFKKAAKAIKKHFMEQFHHIDDPSNSETCNLNNDNDCPMSEMTPDKSTMVTPNADTFGTQCIFGDAYKYQVIPGSSKDLMIYFQGGGACWDKLSTDAGLCTTTAEPNTPTGVFNRENAENPFKDYTIVHVLYCSGDTHVGNVTRSYDYKDSSVVQTGALNVRTTLNWIHEQEKNGALVPNGQLDNLVVMGCSAGSVGTQLWATTLLKEFPAKQQAIVPDSYIGVFPKDALGPLIKNMGFCDTEIIQTPGNVSPEIKQACEAGTLSIPQWVTASMKESSHVSWSYLQSKVDAIQQAFYWAVGLTSGNPKEAIITPGDYYKGVTDICTTYNPNPNFVAYLVDGPMHCFTCMDIMYNSDTYGPLGHREIIEKIDSKKFKDVPPSMSEWLGALPLTDGKSISSQCSGELVSKAPDSHWHMKDGEIEKYTWCDKDLYPKSFTEA
jgi:hypothetical protein